jgi:hypothetical protein
MHARALAAIVTVIGMLALAPAANAGPITGGVFFAGPGQPVGGAWPVSTGVDFTGGWSVVAAGGDYSPLFGSGALATFTDFSYGAASGAVNIAIGSIWTITHLGITYTLQLATITGITRDLLTNSINSSGSGVMTITGGSTTFDPTFGFWNFTGGTAFEMHNLSFSSGSTGVVVPEPASLALLGTGLAGMALGLRRRLRQRQRTRTP